MTGKNDEMIDTRGMNCPQPLIEARKKLRKMERGRVLEIRGDHGMSRKEIPMAVEDTGDEVLDVRDMEDGSWLIRIRRG